MQNITLSEFDLKSMQDALDFFNDGIFATKAAIHLEQSGGDVDFLIEHYNRMIAMPHIANNTDQVVVDYKKLMTKLTEFYKFFHNKD